MTQCERFAHRGKPIVYAQGAFGAVRAVIALTLCKLQTTTAAVLRMHFTQAENTQVNITFLVCFNCLL